MLNLAKYFFKVLKFNHFRLSYSIQYHINVYKRWCKQIETQKKPFELELPWISLISFDFIQNYFEKIDHNEFTIFEYGSGGSSYYFLNNCKQLVSVEHDEEWFNILSKKNILCSTKWDYKLIPPKYVENKDLNCSDPSHYSSCYSGYELFSFSDYVMEIENYPDEYFDIILIDGRSRVSCLKHARKKVKKGGLLVLDNADRDRYFKFSILDEKEFKLIVNHFGALICSKSFVKTNIYVKQ